MLSPPRAIEAQPDSAQHALDAVVDTLEQQRVRLGIPGMSLAVVKDGKVILVRGFGWADLKRHVAATPATRFRIGSATKAFTAMAAAIAQDDGKASFDASPKRYLPEFRLRDPHADSLVTIADLLCHRTGLGRTDNDEFTGHLTGPELVRVLARALPIVPFRTTFQYNNAMVMVAGEAVAAAEGTTWERLVHDRILTPLGMAGTVMRTGSDESGTAAQGYYPPRSGAPPRLAELEDLSAVAPAAALSSTAADMGKWVAFMLSGGKVGGHPVVSDSSFRGLLTAHIPVSATTGYGLGWYLRQWRGHRVVEHGGTTRGFSAEVAFLPDQQLGFALLTNQDNSDIAGTVLNVIWSAFVEDHSDYAATSGTSVDDTLPPARPFPLDAAGAYLSAGGASPSSVVAVNHRLVWRDSRGNEFRLTVAGQDSLAMTSLVGFALKVLRDSSGSATRVRMSQPHAEVEYYRVGLYRPDLSVEQLLGRVAMATGESAFRRHHSLETLANVDFENLGTTGVTRSVTAVVNRMSVKTDRFALGRQISSEHAYFDGRNGGNQGTYFATAEDDSSDVETDKIENAFYGLLDWRTLFKSVEIRARTQLNGEDVYVLRAVPEHSRPIVYYISARTFFTVGTQPNGGSLYLLDDYRAVDGVQLPFTLTERTPGGQRIVSHVTRARFDVAVPDSLFRHLSLRVQASHK